MFKNEKLKHLPLNLIWNLPALFLAFICLSFADLFTVYQSVFIATIYYSLKVDIDVAEDVSKVNLKKLQDRIELLEKK